MTNHNILVQYTFGGDKFGDKFYAVQSSLPAPDTVFYLTLDDKQFYVDEGSIETRRKVWKQNRATGNVTSAEFFSLPDVTTTTNVGRSSNGITSVMVVSNSTVLVTFLVNGADSYGLFLDSLDELHESLRSKLVQNDLDTWKFDQACRIELKKAGEFRYQVLIDGVYSGFYVTDKRQVFPPESMVDITLTKTTLGGVSHLLAVCDTTVVVGEN